RVLPIMRQHDPSRAILVQREAAVDHRNRIADQTAGSDEPQFDRLPRTAVTPEQYVDLLPGRAGERELVDVAYRIDRLPGDGVPDGHPGVHRFRVPGDGIDVKAISCTIPVTRPQRSLHACHVRARLREDESAARPRL